MFKHKNWTLEDFIIKYIIYGNTKAYKVTIQVFTKKYTGNKEAIL